MLTSKLLALRKCFVAPKHIQLWEEIPFKAKIVRYRVQPGKSLLLELEDGTRRLFMLEDHPVFYLKFLKFANLRNLNKSTIRGVKIHIFLKDRGYDVIFTK